MIRTACIGCGRHMKDTLAPVLCSSPNIIVKYCIDLNIDRAKNIAKILNANEFFYKLDLLNKNSIDAAILALTPDNSKNEVEYVLKNRIPAYIEKPVASDSKQIEFYEELRAKYDSKVQVGFNFRFSDGVTEIKKAIGDSKNKLKEMRIQFLSRKPIGPEWGYNDPVGAWLLHNGIHALDLCKFLNNSPIIFVDGKLHMDGERFLIYATFKHNSGSITNLFLGNLTQKFKISIEASLIDDTIIKMKNLNQIMICRPDIEEEERTLCTEKEFTEIGKSTGHISSIENFFEAILKNTTMEPNLNDAIEAAKVGEILLKKVKLNQH